MTEGVTARSLAVEIQQPTPTGALRGTATVVEPDGAVRARQLKAGSCDELVDGLSLIATVTLDPDALLVEPEPDNPPAPAPPRPPLPPPVAEAARIRSPVTPSAPGDRYRWSFGLAAALLMRMAPEPALGGSASLALELSPGAVWAPFLRLSVTHAERRGLREGAGVASFAFTLPTFDACPLRVGPRELGVRPCAFASVGLLEAWGSSALKGETHGRLWGAAGLGLWVGWRASEAFEIIVDGRMGAPLARDRFAFDNVPFFMTPTPIFSAALGAAAGFP